MEGKIRVGICGYGNLGRGVESELANSPDMELAAIFTRRPPNELEVKSGVPVVNVKDFAEWLNKIDVMIMCGGSATDLPYWGPIVASNFTAVDSFDTHAKVFEHFMAVDEAAMKNDNVYIISNGWDPGLFSIIRGYANAILPQGKTETFWGKGVSQGHSDAIRRINGVKDAIQYTIPKEEALKRVRNGERPDFKPRDKHLRECFVVAEEGVAKTFIEEQIKVMPNYFAEYDTVVHFITEEELKKEHYQMRHGGFVNHFAETGDGNKESIEFSLNLDSNPEFTASVLIAYARAAYRLKKIGYSGAFTPFDVPPVLMSQKNRMELIKEIL